MGKYNNCEVHSWADMPIILTVKDINKYLGFGIDDIYAWFRTPGFPRLPANGYKVEKYMLRKWLSTATATEKMEGGEMLCTSLV